jgi:pimeloyl-ACP methyl ester carboxylesterase
MSLLWLAPPGALMALLLLTLWLTRRVEARYPPIGPIVDVGEAAIHMVERAAIGPERGVVLLVHGASGNHADMMAALGAPLSAAGFRVIAVDRPGHAWSWRRRMRGLTSPTRQAALIRAALASRGVAQAVIVVHSWAGVLGLAMALEAPSFARALVLLAPVSHPWPGGVSWYYTLAATPWLGPLFRYSLVMPAGLVSMQGAVRSVFAPGPTPAGYIRSTGLPLVLRPSHFLANAQDVVDLKAHVEALAPRYHEVRAPTVIVTGDRDGVVYAHIHSVGCARDIPGAKLVTLEGVGHSPHHCATERVVEAVIDVERRARAGEAYMETTAG